MTGQLLIAGTCSLHGTPLRRRLDEALRCMLCQPGDRYLFPQGAADTNALRQLWKLYRKRAAYYVEVPLGAEFARGAEALAEESKRWRHK